MKLYQIKENPLIKCNKEIKEYLDTDYIYIPYDKDYELKIKNHELVNLNSVILTNKDKKVYEYELLCCHSNTILLKYYKQKIDNSNIMMMIRNKILNWNKEQFLSMVISKGNISKEVFEKLLKEIADSCDEKVVKALKKYFANKEFYKLENDLEQLLIEKISETKNDALNIGPLLYYYVAKNSEIKNIRMLYSNANVQINDLLAY